LCAQLGDLVDYEAIAERVERRAQRMRSDDRASLPPESVRLDRDACIG
jgi:hypothetical protein